MSQDHEDYELGRNVTHLFKSASKRETSVISVRLSGEEIKRLEELGRDNGKTVSQVIRDAIASYRVQRPEIVIGLSNGSTVIIGEPAEASGNARYEVVSSPPNRVSSKRRIRSNRRPRRTPPIAAGS